MKFIQLYIPAVLGSIFKEGARGKSSKSVRPVDEISMRNSSLFERLAI